MTRFNKIKSILLFGIILCASWAFAADDQVVFNDGHENTTRTKEDTEASYLDALADLDTSTSGSSYSSNEREREDRSIDNVAENEEVREKFKNNSRKVPDDDIFLQTGVGEDFSEDPQPHAKSEDSTANSFPDSGDIVFNEGIVDEEPEQRESRKSLAHTESSAMDEIIFRTGQDADKERVPSSILNLPTELPEKSIPIGKTQALAAPKALRPMLTSARSVVIKWDDTNTKEAGFTIERRQSKRAHFVRLGSASANVTSFTDKKADQGATYQYRIRTFNNKGEESEPSSILTVQVD